MNILTDLFKVIIFINMFRSKRLNEQAPDPFVFDIEIHSVGGADLLHKARNAVFSYFFQQEMKMIWYKTVGANGNQGRLVRNLEYIFLGFVS